MFPIEVTNLILDPTILPPRIVKLRGRPKTIRLRYFEKQARKCGNCDEMTHHNARSCRAQPCDTIVDVIEKASVIEEEFKLSFNYYVGILCAIVCVWHFF